MSSNRIIELQGGIVDDAISRANNRASTREEYLASMVVSLATEIAMNRARIELLERYTGIGEEQ